MKRTAFFSAVPIFDSERFLRAVRSAESALGAPLYVPPPVTGLSSAARALELVRVLGNPEIDAVFLFDGGFGSAELLEHLDLRDVTEKPIIGCGDATALLLGLRERRTYFAPTPRFSDALPRFDEHSSAQPIDFIDGVWRPGVRTQPRAWRDGVGRGRLFGGDLDALAAMIATPYFDPPEEMILFFEVVEKLPFRVARVARLMTQLRQAGILRRVRAMIVGRSPECTPIAGRSLEQVVLESIAGTDFPVIGGAPIGHTDPAIALRIGAEAEVFADGEHVAFFSR